MEQVAFVPITKIDIEKRQVWGVLAEERLDKVGEIMDYAKSKPHFEAWSEQFRKATESTGQELSLGNLRAMHTPLVAGKLIHIGFNDAEKRIEIGTEILDEGEWKKCVKGGYTGFSVGGNYGDKWADPVAKGTRIVVLPREASLADNPCMYGATFSAVKADGGSELRKFVGIAASETTAAEPALAKDAAAAVAVANDALAALKKLASELALLPGEPDTWALDDVISAIRRTVSGKMAAESAAAQPPETPGAGPMEPKAVPAAELAKAEPEAAAALDGGGGEALKTLPDSELLGSLQKIHTAMTEQHVALKALSEGLGKTVGETVTKAVDDAKTQLQKSIDGLGERVQKIESQPAPPGRPAQKAIGGGLAGSGSSEAEEAVAVVLKSAVDAGATPQQLAAMRRDAAAALMPR